MEIIDREELGSRVIAMTNELFTAKAAFADAEEGARKALAKLTKKRKAVGWKIAEAEGIQRGDIVQYQEGPVIGLL